MLLLLAALSLSLVTVTCQEEEVMTVIVNASGKYYIVPAYKYFLNTTWSTYRIFLSWQDKCLLVVVKDVSGVDVDATVNVYGGTTSPELIASFSVHGETQYCNDTLLNYDALLVYIYIGSKYVGPLVLVKPTLVTGVSLSSAAATYLPLVLGAVMIALVASYHMRKMLAGAIMAAAFSWLLGHILPGLNPIFDTPYVRYVIPLVFTVIAIFLAYILEKQPEA